MIRITSFLRNVYRRGAGWLPVGLLGAGLMLGASCSTENPISGGDDPGSGPSTGLTVNGSRNRFVVVGPQGGPFPDGQRNYEIVNSGTESIQWVAQSSEPWLRFSSAGGTLAGGRSETVTVTLDGAMAATLAPGEHPADIVFRQPGAPDAVYVSFLLIVRPTGTGALMVVNPPSGLDATGDVGGVISPDGKTYTIMNSGDIPLDWVARGNQPWIRLSSPNTGTLQPGAAASVIVSINPGASNNLGQGYYQGGVAFLNLTNGYGDTTRSVTLTLDAPASTGDRVVDGLVSLYDFEEANGFMVYDRSGIAPAVNLEVDDMGSVEWAPGALAVRSATLISAQGSAGKLAQRCMSSNEITVEAWITPENVSQEGPARIVTLSSGGSLRNVTLGQGLWGGQPADTFNCRLRTTATDLDGMPILATANGRATTSLTHLVYTRNQQGNARIYVNGALEAESQVGGNLSNWDTSYGFALANEIGTNRPWLGSYHLVALYDRALSAAEVDQNYDVGAGDPDFARITVDPGNDFFPFGPVGGPFSPSSRTYTVTNPSNDPVQWSASVSKNWVRIAGSQGGTLEPGQQASFDVQLVAARANALAAGSHTADITVTNLTNGYGTTQRQAFLTVAAPGGSSDTGMASSLTQYGITWTFDREYQYGQFVTGDYWVVGPVTVTSVSPALSNGNHGSMLNPQNNTAAYDSEIPLADMSLAAQFPLTMVNGDSLVSAKSHSQNPSASNVIYDLTGYPITVYSWLQSAAILTCVAAPQSPTAFRPPYTFGGDRANKPILNASSIDWSRLPTLTPPTNAGFAYTAGSQGKTPPEWYARYFQRPWLFNVGTWIGRQAHPTDNQPNYHEEMHEVVADAALILVSDYPLQHKQQLALGFIQLGIDTFGVTEAPGSYDWYVHKWPVTFAGIMLNYEPMKHARVSGAKTEYQGYYPGTGTSNYSSSIVPASQGWTGASILWRIFPGDVEHEHLHPTEWAQVSGHGRIQEVYRVIHSHTWPGPALAARAMNAVDLWNTPTFFQYADRWMTEPEAANRDYIENLWAINIWGPAGGTTGSGFVDWMWAQYRNNY